MSEPSVGFIIDLERGERRPIALSTTRLDEASEIKRLPKQPHRQRDEKFLSAFDFTTLYYDCFWDQNAKDILCIGPTPTNLKPHYQKAVYRAMPSGKQVKAKHYFSLTVMTTHLKDVPSDTTAIEMHFAGERYLMPVQPNECDMFARENLMFTLSKNNDLKWIDFWADYHVRKQNVSTIILFDNGSDQYEIDDLLEKLAGIKGLKKSSRRQHALSLLR